MKHRILFSLVLLSLVIASCEPGCGRGADCSITKTLYVLNSTAKNIQLDNIRIKPGQKILLKIMEESYIDSPIDYFTNDTAFMIFNDSVVFRHVLLRTDSGFVYIPSEHNILDADSWKTGINDDSWSSWAVYTFNDEDCQRALEMTTI
jgi:hypothetical protein